MGADRELISWSTLQGVVREISYLNSIYFSYLHIKVGSLNEYHNCVQSPKVICRVYFKYHMARWPEPRLSCHPLWVLCSRQGYYLILWVIRASFAQTMQVTYCQVFFRLQCNGSYPMRASSCMLLFVSLYFLLITNYVSYTESKRLSWRE